MPLFEYACRSCDHEFEAYVRASETPACPSCRGTELQRRLSVFAARSSAGGETVRQIDAGGACGACGDPRGPGACSLN